MKLLKNSLLFSLVLMTVVSCKKEVEEVLTTDNSTSISKSASNYTFIPGLLNSANTAIVPLTSLQDLGGGLSGNPIIISNNPEVVVKPGWLFKPPVNAAGDRVTMSGKFSLYLYHDNRAGQDLYLHVFATNPNNYGVTVSAKGNIFNRNQYDGKVTNGQKRGFGPSYQVAANWMSNTFSTIQNPTTIPNKGGYTSLAMISLPNSKTIDGLLEIEASADCFIYVVASSSPNLATAVNLSQNDIHGIGQYWEASAQAFVPTFKPETSLNFGRECGIYTHSGWSGSTSLDLPGSGAHHIGLSLNTTAKSPVPQTTHYLQNQNAPAIGVIGNATIGYASSFTYGNYGHYYNFNLLLNNNANRQRHVKVWLVSNQAGSTIAGFLFHAPVRVAGDLREVYNTGSSPKTLIYDVKYSWETLNVPIQFYVPGLIFAGQQIVVEVVY